MKRTFLPRNFVIEDENLIRSIAWSFHRSSGVDIDELISEGIHAYCEAKLRWDPDQNAKFSTWAYFCITTTLITFVKLEKRQVLVDMEYMFSNMHSNPTAWFEFLDALPQECQQLAKIVLEEKEELAGLSGKFARGDLSRILRKRGWSWNQIWDGFRLMSSTLASIPENMVKP